MLQLSKSTQRNEKPEGSPKKNSKVNFNETLSRMDFYAKRIELKKERTRDMNEKRLSAELSFRPDITRYRYRVNTSKVIKLLN